MGMLEVVQQTAPVGKRLGAVGAGKGVGLVMDVEMRAEALFVVERLAADWALEHLCVGVHLHVELERRHVGEGLEADSAGKGLGVVVHVHVSHVVPA